EGIEKDITRTASSPDTDKRNCYFKGDGANSRAIVFLFFALYFSVSPLF
ncbi:hypothetical protein EZS27_038568, partial [termite gut metagenome]